MYYVQVLVNRLSLYAMAEFCRKCSEEYSFPKSNFTGLCEGCGKRNEFKIGLGKILFVVFIVYQIVIFFLR